MNYEQLLKKYPQEKIDRAIRILSYKTAVDPLPKNETSTGPILYVFRHGQTQDNADFVFSGWRDSPLTEIGRQQALVLATKLGDKKIDYLVSSPQTRAIDTMKTAMSLNSSAKNLEIRMDESIQERCYGTFQGKSKLELFLEDEMALHNLRRSYNYIPEGGESTEAVVKRVFGFCEYIVKFMKENKLNVAVSCHGNSIRGFRKFFENLTDEQTATIETPLAQDYAAYHIPD